LKATSAQAIPNQACQGPVRRLNVLPHIDVFFTHITTRLSAREEQPSRASERSIADIAVKARNQLMRKTDLSAFYDVK
jgi:hypothetical protein